MFHSFEYPDETGTSELAPRFWSAVMCNGILTFPRPEDCPHRRFVRKMEPKQFGLDKNCKPVEQEALA
jgi:CRISPR-associated protein Cas5d